MLEDVNNLLNNGDVPNLWLPEDKAIIMEMARSNAKDEGLNLDRPDLLLNYFVAKTKKLLHMVICFSPIGSVFKDSIRMFPSLVNCCTIDWFFDWPKEALESVAQRNFSELEGVDPTIQAKCVEMVQYFHMSTSEWATKFQEQLGRVYYVTPTSYIEMINQFSSLLGKKQTEVRNLYEKYENGYQQIIEAEESVGGFQVKLEALVPKLELAATKTAEVMKEVESNKVEADKMKEVVQKDKDIVAVKQSAAKKIQDECESDLAVVLPELEAVAEDLKKLNKADIDFLKGMVQAGEGVKKTFEGVCYLLKPVPIKVKNQQTLREEVDWWGTSRKLLNDMTFFSKLQEFDPDSQMDDKMFNQLDVMFTKFAEDLTEEKIARAARAAVLIFRWVRGQKTFYIVNKTVKPKKAALAVAADENRVLSQNLAIKESELKKVSDKVAALEANLDKAKKKKKELEDEYHMSKLQLERAKILIDNLADEKERWKELGIIWKEAYNNLVGDVLVSSGIISYLGPFTVGFRSKIVAEWAPKSLALDIPGSAAFSLIKIMGEPVKIREWNIDGLPPDDFSIENGIIIQISRRYPLCIDPQLQANKWIKKKCANDNIQVIKMEGNYMRKLEDAIRFGFPVIMENIGSEVDAALSPVLLKQTIKQGMSMYIKLGDQTVEFDPKFFFYMTTKFRNPHFLPEVSTKVSIINFMITFEGLADQLLRV
jgi:dynein heavy chain